MNIFKRIAKKSSSSRHPSSFGRFGNDPFIDWAFMFCSALITVVILSAVASFVYFGTIRRLGEETALTVPPRASFDEKALRGILASFDQKETERAAVARGYDGPGDPSI